MVDLMCEPNEVNWKIWLELSDLFYDTTEIVPFLFQRPNS